jgi:glyoxylate carboligase
MDFKFRSWNNGIWITRCYWSKSRNPKQDVVCISGDSSIQMSIQELGTIAQYRLGIRLLLLMDGKNGTSMARILLWK